ncbi:MAG: AAA family ATPase [Blastocatellia bacterium]|nr:AAA family ATPase [Blastocatellia bacterium]
MIVVLAGVSAVGKTTVGKILAERLGWEFLDADDLHPPSNIEKMRFGKPLTDEDRLEWLADVRRVIAEFTEKDEHAVIACSALRQSYREMISVGKRVLIFILSADIETVRQRIESRPEHFMPVGLLESQFETLEIGNGERVIDASSELGETVDAIEAELARRTGNKEL